MFPSRGHGAVASGEVDLHGSVGGHVDVRVTAHLGAAASTVTEAMLDTVMSSRSAGVTDAEGAHVETSPTYGIPALRHRSPPRRPTGHPGGTERSGGARRRRGVE